MSKVPINSLSTGIAGLDRILAGGVPEYSFNVIAGAPGSGKTTLSHQIMFAMVEHSAPALYFTVLGEPPLKMLRYQQQYDFFDEQQIGRSIHYINLAEETYGGDLKQVFQRIIEEVQKHQPKLVFVDSFRSLVLASETEQGSSNRMQQFMQQLGQLLTSWQVTSFLIGEYINESGNSPLFTVADGLIWLRQSVQRNSMVRKLEVMKMRGQPTLPGLHTYRIVNAKGIEVFPPTDLAISFGDTFHGPGDSRLLMGVPHLDEMLGGGLPRGYSLLVAGPSGSGKTILASAFLAEGVRAGETGVLVSFEQNPFRSGNRVFADMIKNGQVSLVDRRAPDLSIDELSLQLIAEIHRIKASRVVIDSLSGFELSLAPTFREDFRESLARMVKALASTGATVLMVCELEDRYNDLRFSPYGTAFLTDAIIVQRYIEVSSRLLRVMAVVKVRASAHSNELRQFTVDSDGLHVGDMLIDQEGILGGRPTIRSSSGSA